MTPEEYRDAEEMANDLRKCLLTCKGIFGKDYESKIMPWRIKLFDVMKEIGKDNPLFAVEIISKTINRNDDSITLLLSAAADIMIKSGKAYHEN